MRSRYSAYVLERPDHLLATWHASTRPPELHFDHPVRTAWLGLDIVRAPAPAGDEAIVEFVARYREGGGRAQRHHETSRFLRAEGQWQYVEALTMPPASHR